VKVLWHSNSGHVGTGYGNQTDLFVRKMAAEGHDVYVSAFYGLQGSQIQVAPNIRILPSDNGDYGQHDLVAHYEHLKPDVTVGLMDVWVMHPPQLQRLPNFTSWCPVDHAPIPPHVLARLTECRYVWAMSRFGYRQMRENGITDAWYVPHGVDTKNSFFPMDRAEARAKLNIDKDTFVVTCAAANKGFPSRKNLPSLLKAWGAFVKAKPDSVLVLHSDPRPTLSQLDLMYIARFYGVPSKNIIFPDPYMLDIGGYTAKHLNWMYNAGDVFCLPSMGEGFGIPAMEAQAAGSPVILTDFSAQTELVAPGGWLIQIDPFNDLQYTPQLSEQAYVSPGRILQALALAYECRHDTERRAAAREFALGYDADRVWEKYMKPAIDAQLAEATPEQRTQERIRVRSAAITDDDIRWAAQNGIQIGSEPAITLKTRDAAGIEAAIRQAGVQQGVGPQSALPKGAGWAISQSPKEAAAFLAKMDALGVRSVLEIGTYNGGLARFMGEVMGWNVTSVDIAPPVAAPKGYTFVQADSRAWLPPRTYDLVFIDGDHSYTGVRSDYARFYAYADKVIALHDVLGNHACEGVRAFFAEAGGPEWTVEQASEWPLGIAWREVKDAKELEMAGD
jgi:glycosyltransferase involved in cell wall biosynthesis